MSRKITRPAAALGVALTVAVPTLASAADRVQSYRDAHAAFMAEQAAQPDPPGLTEADRATMQEAQRELADRLTDPGLRVGERAPDFKLPNAAGETVRLSEFLRQGPVVLVFYRGAWCPYCNLHLRALAANQAQFDRAGARIVAITPQQPDMSLRQFQEEGYPFEILSDLDSQVMKAYRLYFELSPELVEVYRRGLSLDLAEYNGEGRYVLPVPATYVIDREGIVRAAAAEVDYTQRMEPADILTALQRLR